MTTLSLNNLDLVKPNWAHGRSAGRLYRLSVHLIASSHLWGTLVNRSALFWLDLTKDTFIDSANSFTSFIIVSSHRRMSISLAALVRSLALPVRVSEINLWSQAESVNKCKVFQRIAKFIPLIMASVRLIRWESFAGRNQLASSTTAPSNICDTPVARELASTHTLRAWPSMHHLYHAGSSLRTLVRSSLIMVLRRASSILSSHPAVTSDALRLVNATVTRSQLHTGRCPTNLPHSENTFRCVTTRGMSGILFPLLQNRELSSP